MHYLKLFRKSVAELRVLAIAQKTKKEIDEEIKAKERKEVINNTDTVYKAKKTIFHEIAPGSFKMGVKQVDTIITKPFAMMSTQVTQAMWAQIKIAAGERDHEKIHPSENKAGEYAIEFDINGIKVEMNQNHPVENISWDDASDFINDLNRLSNSKVQSVQNMLINIIPGHQKGDHYDLPTEAQWEFVMRNRGRATEEYFDSANVEDVSDYAWHQFNSDDHTHEVATKKPRIIDGKDFYDLEGNVYEWMRDLFDNHHLPGGKDPTGVLFSPYRALRGGPYSHDPHDTSANARYGFLPDSPSEEMGFRLVRTRPN